MWTAAVNRDGPTSDTENAGQIRPRDKSRVQAPRTLRLCKKGVYTFFFEQLTRGARQTWRGDRAESASDPLRRTSDLDLTRPGLPRAATPIRPHENSAGGSDTDSRRRYDRFCPSYV